MTSKTSRLDGTSLLRIEGDVFFFVCEFTGRGPHDLLKFACKWRHQPIRVPGASGPPRCQGKVNQAAAAQLSIDALYWDNTFIMLTCIVS